MIFRTRNAIKSNAKINCMSNKHDALRKLKLRALESNKHQTAIKTKIQNSTKEN